MKRVLTAAGIIAAIAVSACSPAGVAQVNAGLQTPAGALFCVLQKPGITVVANVVNAEASKKAPGAAPVLILAENAAAAFVQQACDRAALAGGYSGGAPTSPPAGGAVVPPVAIPSI